MTLHWWMHWFWITVVTALAVASVTVAGPAFKPYALPLQEEQTESQDDSLSPVWSTQHMSAEDMWDLYHFTTTSSAASLELSPELEDASVSTYLPVETDTSEVFTADEIVPVQKSSTLIPKFDSEKLNLSEEVKESINNDDSSVVIALKDVYSVQHLSQASVENTSLDAVINSNSQGVDKPIVNVPRLITRDLKNSSELSSAIASHEPLPTVQTGYFPQSFHLHPLFISSGLPSESSSFPPNDFQQGPKIFLDDVNAGLTADITINDSGEVDSRTVWIKPYDKTDLKKPVDGMKNSPLDDAEMGDGPYNPPESSTVMSPKTRNLGETPVPSDDLVVPTDKPHESPTTGKVIVKVTPPLLSISKAVNVTTQSGKMSSNATRTGPFPFPVLNTEGNASVGVENNTTHDKNSTTEDPRSVEGKNSTNITHTSEDEIAVLPTVVPVSNRVQAPAPPDSDRGLDAASITGISLGILVFAALIGAVSFVLYRRRFLNKPQTLNDKCSNPDSSGYIDDSTLRENSEEMYSLDNDSFLNSLEAMTIQNYWTDNRVISTQKFGVLTEMMH